MATERFAMRPSIHKNIRSLAVHETPAFYRASSVIIALCARHTLQLTAVSKELKRLRKPEHRVTAGLLSPCSPFVKTLRVHAKA